MRRPHAGHARDDGEPRLPQRRRDRVPAADPVAAHAPRRDGRRDLRQGPARDDAGAGGAGRSARCHRPRRRDAAADRRRGRRRGADDRRPLHPRQAHGARSRRARLRGLRDARRRLPVPRHGRDERRSSPRRSGWRSATRRSRPPASPSGSSWRAARRARCRTCRGAESGRRTSSPTTPCTTRWSCTRPSAARRICCCTFRRSPTRRACGGRRSRTGRASTARCRASSACCPNGPVDHPTVRVFLAGGVPEVMLHLRDLGLLRLDALTVHRPPARRRARRVGAQRPAHARARAAGRARRHRSRRGHPHARAGPRAGHDEHRLLSARQSRAGGLGHQEHGDRPRARRRRRRLSPHRPGAGVHERARGDRGDQGGRTHRRGRRDRA